MHWYQVGYPSDTKVLTNPVLVTPVEIDLGPPTIVRAEHERGFHTDRRLVWILRRGDV